MSSNFCLYFFNHITSLTIPPEWDIAKKQILLDSKYLCQLLDSKSPPSIYGVNTLVGHMDSTNINTEKFNWFQEHLINNHAFAPPPYYDDFEARCMGYAKVQALSLGGSAVSIDLFELIISAVADKSFSPKIPKHATYSCGDVIPAAHWANAIIHYPVDKYSLKPKEGISLINGSFIHVGLGIAQLKLIKVIWNTYLFASILNAKLCQANPSNYTNLLTEDSLDPINYLSRIILQSTKSRANSKAIQDPISIRAFPQIASAFSQSIEVYLKTLDQSLSRRSDNPLILDGNQPLSQASFLTPSITLASSQLIEAILMAMWSVERRVHHLLSGKVVGIPINGGSTSNILGYIQIPKLLTAVLEESRMVAGRRSFSSGTSTSYGTEDFWSFGVPTLESLKCVCSNFIKLLAIELITSVQCAHEFNIAIDVPENFYSTLNASPALVDQITNVMQSISDEGLSIPDYGYPF